MGFSPGEFKSRDGEEYHLELKSGPRIVLWSHNELQLLLSLDLDNAKKLLANLELLVSMAEAGAI